MRHPSTFLRQHNFDGLSYIQPLDPTTATICLEVEPEPYSSRDDDWAHYLEPSHPWNDTADPIRRCDTAPRDWGDVTCDGDVTFMDVLIVLLTALFGVPLAECASDFTADSNFDNKVDEADGKDVADCLVVKDRTRPICDRVYPKEKPVVEAVANPVSTGTKDGNGNVVDYVPVQYQVNEVDSDLTWWELGGGRRTTADTKLSCLSANSEYVAKINNTTILDLEVPDDEGGDAVICRHLTGDPTLPGQNLNWLVDYPPGETGNNHISFFMEGYGRTLRSAQTGKIYEGCTHLSHVPYYNELASCDFWAPGGYSVNFGVPNDALDGVVETDADLTAGLGSISDAAACIFINRAAVAGDDALEQALIAEHTQAMSASLDPLASYDPCGSDKGSTDTEEAGYRRLDAVTKAAPHVELIFEIWGAKAELDECDSVIFIDCFLRTYNDLESHYTNLKFDFGDLPDGCDGIPYGFAQELCGEGSSIWPVLANLLIDIAIGFACAAALSTGPGAVIVCGGLGALAGQLAENIIAGNDWHENLLQSGIIGATAAGIFGRLGKRLRFLRNFRSTLCSFSGDTPVLMADGSLKAIDNVHVGDLVIAADPSSGEVGARSVTATLPHHGHALRSRPQQRFGSHDRRPQILECHRPSLARGPTP